MWSPHLWSRTQTVGSSGGMTKYSRAEPHEYAISARVRSSVLCCGIVIFLFENTNLSIQHSSNCINVPTLLTWWTLGENEINIFFFTSYNIVSNELFKHPTQVTHRETVIHYWQTCLQGPTNTRSTVASTSSPDGVITLTPPFAMVLNKSSKVLLGSAWNTVHGTKYM